MNARWLGLGVAIALLLACGKDDAPAGPEGRLAQAVQAAGTKNQPLKLAEATTVAWERAYVFPPYTPARAIERDLGFAWPEAARTGIEESDGISLLVFTQGRKVVQWLAYPRHLGDWAMIENHSGYTPADAVLRVTHEGADPSWWIVTETRPTR